MFIPTISRRPRRPRYPQIRLANRLRSLKKAAVTGMLLLFTSQPLLAEQQKSFGEYDVLYSAFASTFLTPAIAKQYDIVRSRSIGVVNISVMKKSADGILTPTAAQLEGLVINDIHQQRHLGFRRIKEGRAVYYIAEVQYLEGEVLTFEVSATPEGQQQPLKLRFSQTFYNERK